MWRTIMLLALSSGTVCLCAETNTEIEKKWGTCFYENGRKSKTGDNTVMNRHPEKITQSSTYENEDFVTTQKICDVKITDEAGNVAENGTQWSPGKTYAVTMRTNMPEMTAGWHASDKPRADNCTKDTSAGGYSSFTRTKTVKMTALKTGHSALVAGITCNAGAGQPVFYDNVVLHPPDHLYDYIVVGSGPGGMAAAQLLSAHNKKVVVLERAADIDKKYYALLPPAYTAMHCDLGLIGTGAAIPEVAFETCAPFQGVADAHFSYDVDPNTTNYAITFGRWGGQQTTNGAVFAPAKADRDVYSCAKNAIKWHVPRYAQENSKHNDPNAMPRGVTATCHKPDKSCRFGDMPSNYFTDAMPSLQSHVTRETVHLHVQKNPTTMPIIKMTGVNVRDLLVDGTHITGVQDSQGNEYTTTEHGKVVLAAGALGNARLVCNAQHKGIDLLHAPQQSAASSENKKILCLHGGGDTAAGLSNQQGMKDLVAAFPDYEFVFASSQNIEGSPYTWLKDAPDKNTPTRDLDWANATIDYLNSVVQLQGPFYGILGYSQGAAMIPIYLSRVPDHTFEIAMMYNGYDSSLHIGLMDQVARRQPFGGIRAVVVTATNDYLIPRSMSVDAARRFATPTIITSSYAGHALPTQTDPAFARVQRWLEAQEDYVADQSKPYGDIHNHFFLHASGQPSIGTHLWFETFEVDVSSPECKQTQIFEMQLAGMSNNAVSFVVLMQMQPEGRFFMESCPAHNQPVVLKPRLTKMACDNEARLTAVDTANRMLKDRLAEGMAASNGEIVWQNAVGDADSSWQQAYHWGGGLARHSFAKTGIMAADSSMVEEPQDAHMSMQAASAGIRAAMNELYKNNWHQNELETTCQKAGFMCRNMCCKAMTAQCMACSKCMSVEEFCKRQENQKVQGCKDVAMRNKEAYMLKSNDGSGWGGKTWEDWDKPESSLGSGMAANATDGEFVAVSGHGDNVLVLADNHYTAEEYNKSMHDFIYNVVDSTSSITIVEPAYHTVADKKNFWSDASNPLNTPVETTSKYIMEALAADNFTHVVAEGAAACAWLEAVAASQQEVHVETNLIDVNCPPQTDQAELALKVSASIDAGAVYPPTIIEYRSTSVQAVSTELQKHPGVQVRSDFAIDNTQPGSVKNATEIKAEQNQLLEDLIDDKNTLAAVCVHSSSTCNCYTVKATDHRFVVNTNTLAHAQMEQRWCLSESEKQVCQNVDTEMQNLGETLNEATSTFGCFMQAEKSSGGDNNNNNQSPGAVLQKKDEKKDDSGTDVGMIVGIAGGCIALLGIAIAVVVRYNRSQGYPVSAKKFRQGINNSRYAMNL